MGVRDRRWRAIATLVALACCLQGTASSGAPAEPEPVPAPTPPDTARIRSLPGYQAAEITTQAFPGQVYVLEAGSGEGPPAILIHGIAPDGAHDWDQLIPLLAARQRVIALDLPGFGRSSRPDGAPYTPESYANLIDEIIASRVEGSYDLVAHSMGVSVALEVARRHPERVHRLLLVSGAALLHGQALSLEEIENKQKELGAFGGLLDGVRHGAFDLMGHVPDRFMHRLALAMPGESSRRAAAGVMAHDSGPALAAIVSPTLIVWGGEDEIASERGAWSLASRIDGARLEFIRAAGHQPMTETPSAFNELATRWLAGEVVGRALDPPDRSSTRDAGCERNRGTKKFYGAYRKITIEACEDVSLEGVRAQEIDISHSEVVGRDVVVVGDQVALSLYRARLKLSGGTLQAATALKLRGSEADLAGVKLRGDEFAVEALGSAKILCSLCAIEAGGKAISLHGFYTLEAGGVISPESVPR